VKRLLLLPVLAVLALPAAGCGGGAPSSFADCRDSTTRGGDESSTPVLPRTYDCLVRAYRNDCRPAKASISQFGIDAGNEVAVRLYRRGSRCAGDVTVDAYVMEARHKGKKLSCGQAYLFGGKLSLFGCGEEGEFAFTRGQDCTHLFERMRQRACRRAGVKCPPPPKPARPFPLAC
jgi:hypothetical protein